MNKMKSTKPILLVEDDQADAYITQQALNTIGVANKLIHQPGGEEAIEYLNDSDNEPPCLVLLDLNMPRMSGFDFLKIVKADRKLKRTPIVILSTSDARRNIQEGYDLGAAGYIVKPVDFNQFVEAMQALNSYWSTNMMPNAELISV
ncbi:MAG: response regulator [Phycisphaerae bacterium]|nr:response regulator [Phycisphaerae bacterium]